MLDSLVTDHTDALSAAPVHAASTKTYSKIDQKKLAIKDIVDNFFKWRIWLMLAYQDIKLRYRRSTIGPFWTTLSMAITVYSMGYLYSHLFKVDLPHYFPFLVSGMLSWNFLSTSIIELTEAYTDAAGMMKQIKMPYLLYINRVIARNMIIFFHNILVMLPVVIAFHETASLNWHTWLLVPGLLLWYTNAIIYGVIFAMIGCRFRDMLQVIKNLVQVVFFMTPIMWSPSILPAKQQYIVLLNPFYSFIELIRCPLMGVSFSLYNLTVVLIATVIGAGISFKIFTRYRARIVYWL